MAAPDYGRVDMWICLVDVWWICRDEEWICGCKDGEMCEGIVEMWICRAENVDMLWR